MSCDWDDILTAYLHAPPDKALAIPGHERRACRYLAAAVGREVSREEIHGTEDQLASIAERLPMPGARAGDGMTVEPADGHLTVFHPLAGTEYKLAVGTVDEAFVEQMVHELVSRYDDPQRRFLTIWRELSPRLTKARKWFGGLPADTRVPDQTIWHHLSITAGLKAALSGRRGGALLSFSLGPVQPFIWAARSVRDLWSGSMILSWLTFQGMLPVIERFGPTGIVFPSLHGTPLLDLWLRREMSLEIAAPAENARKTPCLPNRFLAAVPWDPDTAEEETLARACAARARSGWKRLTEAVRGRLASVLQKEGLEHDGWDKRWGQQTEDFFEIHTAVLPLRECGDEALAALNGGERFRDSFPDLDAVRRLGEAIPDPERPRYRQDSAGRWQAQVELSARLMESHRSVRHIPQATTDEIVPAKCSLFGTFEQMGPEGLEESRRFWEDATRVLELHGVRLRSRERLCAVALAKRFSAPAFVAEELELRADELHFPDTATVAATQWLKRAQIDPRQVRRNYRNVGWSGQWLHWSKRESGEEGEADVPPPVWEAIRRARDKLGPPPGYYVVLVIDGDEMGSWLAGERSPKVREILHAKASAYFARLEGTADGLEANRPLGPARHAAISQALANFAVHVVPTIVAKHHGTLIYAGGDDMLALLPCRAALDCAQELRLAFSGDTRVNGGAWEGYYQCGELELLMMGPTATASAGLAVVHHKEDLRFALETARAAERAAKDCGRDMLQITACRRSGEHASVLCPWDFADEVRRWIAAFEGDASDRWAYRLRRDLETLQGLPVEAVRGEIRRQVERAEPATRQRLQGAAQESAGEAMAVAFDSYYATLTGSPWSLDGVRVLKEFVILCQTASFLARGKEER